MSSAHKIARLKMDDDVFAAEETKVHTLSQQAIADMLETAERHPPLSSAPPPPLSGVRTVDYGGAPEPSALQSGERAVVRVWDEDDEGLEPTRLSERMLLPRPAMVTELLDSPPVIVRPSTPPSIVPAPVALVPVAILPAAYEAPGGIEGANDASLERRARLITLAAFVLTLVPALAAVYYFVTTR